MGWVTLAVATYAVVLRHVTRVRRRSVGEDPFEPKRPLQSVAEG